MSNGKYVHEQGIHRSDDAQRIVPIVMELFRPQSVVDVGCGLGHFLSEFQRAGVQDIMGIEGMWLDKTKLIIEERHVQLRDLENHCSLGRKFDVALCLEVAEHLRPDSAENLVEMLTSFSDIIIFSAAIPYQGGQNHVNEQWIEYWETLFNSHHFHTYDLIRHRIWNDKNIHWWYRQNIVVCCRAFSNHKFERTPINNYIHPELYTAKVARLHGYSTWIDKIFNGDVEVEILEQLLAKAKMKKDVTSS